ncbi:hypothetical protein [Hyphomicrobium sp.]|uniref:hypothetical protein n=1 Tax=Hyphomicrobium sp. TaxID=82 RepID=UPI002D772D01|nr:hypothetical protein [Hyphomicrobium sp.]HET6388991.1 hypothetical protein [Hyphomicrobium sp.]
MRGDPFHDALQVRYFYGTAVDDVVVEREALNDRMRDALRKLQRGDGGLMPGADSMGNVIKYERLGNYGKRAVQKEQLHF